jgi:hypothetical protein
MATYYFRNAGTDWGTAANWSLTDGGGPTGAVPLATDDVIFTNNSGNCTVNSFNRVCRTLNFSSYTNGITMTFQITVSGNVTLGASMGIVGASTLNINATATLTSNSRTWPNSLNLLGTSTIFTLADNWVVTGSLTQNGTSNVLNNNGTTKTITLGGGLTINTSSLTGTANIIMGGTGTLSSTTSGLFLRNNLEINTAGTITFGTNFTYNTGTFTYTAGTIVSAASTFNISVATTFVINAPGFTINILNATANITFSGTNGCTITTFSVRTTTAAITHTFQSLRVYNITTLSLSGVTGFLVSIVASTPSSQAILTLGSVSNNYLLNVTDINSSLGSAATTYGGTVTNSLNWTASASVILYYIGSTNYSGSNVWSNTSGGTAIPSITAPVATDPVVFDASSGNCIINVAGVAASVVFTAYTNTITFTNTLSISGSITLGASMAFAGAASLRYVGIANSTFTSNAKEVGVPFEIAAATNNHTITYADNWTFGENFTIQSGTANVMTFTGNTINCKKSLLTNNTVARYITGTTSIIMIGTGSIGTTPALNSVNVGLNLTINTAGSYTFNTFIWGYLGSKTLTYTAGTITVTAATTLLLRIEATATNILNLNGIDFENITMAGGGTYTLTSDLKCKLLTHGDNTANIVVNGSTLYLTSYNNSLTFFSMAGSTIFYFNCWSGNGSVNSYAYAMTTTIIDISNGNSLTLGNITLLCYGTNFTHLQGSLFPIQVMFSGTTINIQPNVVFERISGGSGVDFTLLSNITVRTLGISTQ